MSWLCVNGKPPLLRALTKCRLITYHVREPKVSRREFAKGTGICTASRQTRDEELDYERVGNIDEECADERDDQKGKR